ncbi:hypothetical protein H6F98_19625 [Microcoleus sp. FACHB-SPT15]|uniref:hypothetical protein n=1 Tax=Microcoleus sp. FACHB-SPT15 TaxID=2692830 RepID=UPI00177D8EAE|nr:hypothetical protein [Microcoleus sp. FACHB-SPT15]MBD1807637.1 hypothetical protein [Microcoleus sp. FACHB-SPT15]
MDTRRLKDSSRDGKKGTLQIVFGLLCDAQGCPVAVEVFEGNTADSTTLQAQRRAHKREELLQATEQELKLIVAATQRSVNRLRGKDAIGVRVAKVINRFKIAKHFSYEITDDSFNYQRNLDSITNEARLDGIYVVRTSVVAEKLTAPKTVSAYKSLSQVEQAFRCYKSVNLQVRPIHPCRTKRLSYWVSPSNVPSNCTGQNSSFPCGYKAFGHFLKKNFRLMRLVL